MKTKAAVLWGLNEKWQVEEVELDGPKEGEVLVKLTANGLCHSDEHLVTGDIGHLRSGVREEGQSSRHSIGEVSKERAHSRTAR